MIVGQVAQGDVLITPAPPGTKRGQLVPLTGDRIVIARGEISGHSHTIPSADARLYELDPINTVRRLLVAARATVMAHGAEVGDPDHAPVPISEGEHLIILQEHIVGDQRQQVGD
jgi:hypothetical protein